MRKVKFLFITALLGMAVGISAQTYTVNTEKSAIKWDAQKVIGSGHYGTVDVKEGTLKIADNKIKSAKVIVDMNSITNNDGKDGEPTQKLIGHLKSDDFFSVETYETAYFVLTGSGEFENNEAKVYGRLTIKGTTQPIDFVAKRDGNILTTKLSVDRTLFDVRYGSGKFFDGLGDNMINDHFDLDIQLVLQ